MRFGGGGGYTGQVVSLVEDIRASFYSSSSSETSFGLQRRLRFRVMPLFEGLYLLPFYRCHYSGCVELHEVVCRVVLCTGHHLWPEPSFCEFMRGPVLIVDTSAQSPSPIFLCRSPTSACFPSGFVPGPRFFRSCHRPLHVFRLRLKLSDASCEQLLHTHFIGDSLFQDLS